jgi:fucose permease
MSRIILAFAGFILVGIGAGVSGVLIPSQIADYHVDKVAIGLMFFAASGGYALSAVSTGTLIRRLGVRGQLSLGAGIFVLMSFAIGLRPSFPLLLLASVLLGFGTGILDAGLNAFLTTLPRHESLLHHLHAFFGVGALIGPVLAAQLLHLRLPWQDVYLVMAALALPLLVGFAVFFPQRAAPVPEEHSAPLPLALRRREVWLAGTFLCLYVGIEVTVGNWGFSLLTQQHGQGEVLAGWVVSGYWLGLTLGRFLLNASASRAGIGVIAMMYACLGGVLVATILTWWGPGALVVALGFALIGFFLGPVFPTTIGVTPQLIPARLVPTAVGLLVGASVVGGAFFPWLAGALAQSLGLGSLLPYALILGVIQVGGWWMIARRIRIGSVP